MTYEIIVSTRYYWVISLFVIIDIPYSHIIYSRNIPRLNLIGGLAALYDLLIKVVIIFPTSVVCLGLFY